MRIRRYSQSWTGNLSFSRVEQIPFCDVERAVLARLRKSNLLDAYRALRAAEVEGAERALLAKLREKYEGSPASSQTSAPILHPGAPPKTRRTGQQSGQTSLF